jgi:hypothetical protein
MAAGGVEMNMIERLAGWLTPTVKPETAEILAKNMLADMLDGLAEEGADPEMIARFRARYDMG